MKIKLGAAKARKIRQRAAAGRPRLEGERYPSGDRKRSETREETMSVAVEARLRQHGVQSVIFKGRDLAGFTLGRMHLDKKVSEVELEAGIWFAEHMERYYRSVGIPSPNPRAQDLLAVRGHDGDPSQTMQERATRATNMMMRLEGILLRAGPGVKQTVRNVCVEDMETLRLMPPAQLKLLKAGLRALALAKGVE
jgi:hypothetical protein